MAKRTGTKKTKHDKQITTQKTKDWTKTGAQEV